MISVKHSGSFDKTERFFKNARKSDYLKVFQKYGSKGVEELSLATPVDTGLTKNLWTYEIQRTRLGVVLRWSNGNVVDGIPVAILIQYGHATKNGGIVRGIDYINPALRKTFDKITTDLIREVNAL